jgi:hypothetical protein
MSEEEEWLLNKLIEALVKAGYSSLASAFARKAEETENTLLLATYYVALEVEELAA